MTANDQGPFGPINDAAWLAMTEEQRTYLIYQTVKNMCQHCGANRSPLWKIINLGVIAVSAFLGGMVANICGLSTTKLNP